MPTLNERVRTCGSILTVSLMAAPAGARAGDGVPVAVYASPVTPIQLIQPAPSRPAGMRWPDNPLRRRRAAQPMPTVWWVAPPVAQAAGPPSTIPREFLDAIRVQISQARKGDGAINDDELFARSASTLRTLKGSAPTDAELSEIRSLFGQAGAPEPAAPAASPVALMPTPLSLHICNRFCRHR